MASLRERVGSPGVDAGAADGPQLVVGVGVAEVALVGVVEHGRDLVPENGRKTDALWFKKSSQDTYTMTSNFFLAPWD